MITVGEALVSCLEALQVDAAFGVLGGGSARGTKKGGAASAPFCVHSLHHLEV